MPAVSRYEDAAQAFLKAHPIGTVVTAEKVLSFAAKEKNGLASDMLVDDPAKRFSAVRRHLNDGGASRNLPEENRFRLVIEDAKRKTIVVVALSEHVRQQADQAFGKSVTGAITPLVRAQKAIDDVKLEELSDEERQELENTMKELMETTVPVKRVFSEQVVGRWMNRLEARGYSAEQARHLIEILPTMTKLQKLLKATS